MLSTCRTTARDRRQGVLQVNVVLLLDKECSSVVEEEDTISSTGARFTEEEQSSNRTRAAIPESLVTSRSLQNDNQISEEAK